MFDHLMGLILHMVSFLLLEVLDMNSIIVKTPQGRLPYPFYRIKHWEIGNITVKNHSPKRTLIRMVTSQ